jgi:protein XagA
MSLISFNNNNRLVAPLIFALCIAPMTISEQAYAGAWTGPQGASYHKLGLNSFSADKALDGDRNSVDAGSTFTDLNLTYYGEYGIRDNMSVFGSVPFKTLESDPDVGSSVDNTGIGDITVGLRYNLYNGDWGVFSVQGHVELPAAYDEKDTVPLGSGDTDVEIRLLYGKSLYPLPMYIGAEGGYRFSEGSASDEVKYLLEFGYTATDKISLRAKLDGSVSAKNAGTVTTSAGNPTLVSDFDLAKLELTGSYAMRKDLYLEFTLTPTLSGRDTADGTTISFAVIYAIQP